MTTHNLNSSNDGQTFNYTASALQPQIVNVTTTLGDPSPTVTVDASLLAGSFTVDATAGATANVDEVLGAAGVFHLTADGGTINASAAVGVLSGNVITIQNGGTFEAGSTFLGVLDGSTVTFGSDTTKTDTLVLDNGGGLLSIALTPGIAGFVAGGHEVIDDRLVAGADVKNYSISQTGVGQPQTLTYLDAGGGGLGSVTFAAGTFSSGQLGTFAVGSPSGPLQLKVAGDGGVDVTFCFLAGTGIRTPTGDIAVESLGIGDPILTYEGAVKPVLWIGVHTVSTRFADPLTRLPIRIRAGALGEGLPVRDLLVSPDHALFIDGMLIQAAALVNASSIVRETQMPQTFKYYHVEVEGHALILAEGAPAETFVDNVDRMAFDNWDEYQALYPEGREMEELPYPRAKAPRQISRAIRARLEACAMAVSGAQSAAA